jgi:hypothetical protein
MRILASVKEVDSRVSAVEIVVRHYRRSSITVSEIGLPFMLIGGRRGHDLFEATSNLDFNQSLSGWTTPFASTDFYAAKSEYKRRQTSACFSRASSLIASTISPTADSSLESIRTPNTASR